MENQFQIAKGYHVCIFKKNISINYYQITIHNCILKRPIKSICITVAN